MSRLLPLFQRRTPEVSALLPEAHHCRRASRVSASLRQGMTMESAIGLRLSSSDTVILLLAALTHAYPPLHHLRSP